MCIRDSNKTCKVFGVADWLDDTNMIVRANSLSEVLEKLKRTTISVSYTHLEMLKKSRKSK